jgi:Tfp pilus assembly protein PilN
VDFLEKLLLFLHLIGMAAVVGGALVQIATPPRRITAMILHGGLTQVVTGVLLVGVLEADDADVNHAKIGVKLAVALVIVALAWIYRAREQVSDAVYFGILALALGNVGIAVFWT